MKVPMIVSIVAVAWTFQAYAQTPSAAPTPPLPPFINRAPDSTQWVVLYKTQANSGDSQNMDGKMANLQPLLPVQENVIKAKGMVMVNAINGNGAKSEAIYFSNGLAAISQGGSNWMVGSPSDQSFDSCDYSRQDFAGFDWISAENFAGSKQMNGRTYLIFKDRVVTISPAQVEAIKSDMATNFSWVPLDKNGKPLPITPEMEARRPKFNIENYKSDVTAYIDDQTRLPIALVYKTRNGTVTRTYQFQPAKGSISIPPDAFKAIEVFRARQKSLSAPRAPV